MSSVEQLHKRDLGLREKIGDARYFDYLRYKLSCYELSLAKRRRDRESLDADIARTQEGILLIRDELAKEDPKP